MYNIIRKHSEDQSSHIVDTAPTAAEAIEKIKKIIEDENAGISTPHETRTIRPVTNTKFTMDDKTTYSIGYWFEKA